MTCRRCDGTGLEAVYRGKLLGVSITRAARVLAEVSLGKHAELLAACRDRWAVARFRIDLEAGMGLRYALCSDCEGLRIVQVDGIAST